MKTFCAAIFFSVTLMLCSCSTYYYTTLNSNSTGVVRGGDGRFTIENDSVYISYYFYGEDAPIRVSIANKTDHPMFIDWSRSAVIVNDVALNYQGNQVPIEMSTWYGTATLPVGAEFIPPKSKVVRTHIKLNSFPFTNIPNDKYEKTDFVTSRGKIKVKSLNFSQADSPLAFRSYLTLYDGETGMPMCFEQEFFVSEVVKTGNVTPSGYCPPMGDKFYVRHVSSAGGIAALVVIGASLVALDAVTPNDD